MLVLFTNRKWHTQQCAVISATAELCCLCTCTLYCTKLYCRCDFSMYISQYRPYTCKLRLPSSVLLRR